MSFDPESLDFDRCEDEPIHRPEAIQGYGYLMALEPDTGIIRIHSDNLATLFPPSEAVSGGFVGRSFYDWVDVERTPQRLLHEVYLRAAEEKMRLPVQLQLEPSAVVGERTLFHGVVFESDGYLILELEPATAITELIAARHEERIYAQNMTPSFQSLAGVGDVAQAIADVMRRFTAFERVIVYRFNGDGTGTVISESKVDDMPSYLGLTYPASDIPAQARELYLRNWIRLNPDVALEPVGLTPTLKQAGRKPLDLSLSIVRAMSPIHAQYVLNQGLRASMSVSLVMHGELWGLISCHHREPHYLPQEVRLECESLGHLFAWQLYAKQEEVERRQKAEADDVVDGLIEHLGQTMDIVDIFQSEADEVLSLMGACGFVYGAGRRLVCIGQTPSEEVIRALGRRAANDPREEPFSTDRLGDLVTGDLNGCHGALVVPMFTEQEYYTLWFRSEEPRTIRWAGNPDETFPDAPKRERLSPRVSFKVHERVVEGESAPWSPSSIEVALRLNKFFLQHTLREKTELQQDVAQLEVRDRTKNEFLATLAHELRNPLSPISNALSILEKSDVPEDREEGLAIVNRQLGHLVKLVDDLLDVSRITRGQVRLEREVVDLRSVLADAIELNEPAIARKEQTFELDQPSDPVRVWGDRTRLVQVFGNVINNAVKYTDPSAGIRVKLGIIDGRATVQVEDDGIGLAPEQMEGIFETFTQVHGADSPLTRGGLGIGLTLVRSLLRHHDGDIRVSSEGPGQGSCFVIELPLHEGNARASAAPVEPPKSASGPRAHRILVVDDNLDLASMLCRLLQLKGHEVAECHDAHEALAAFDELKPDIALLDLGLPEIDGHELCRLLQQKEGGDRVVYVAQTGWGQNSDRQRSLEAGFAYHLVKPLTEETIDRMLAEVGDRTDE